MKTMMRPITLSGLEHDYDYRAFVRRDHVSDKNVLYVCFVFGNGLSDNYFSGDWDSIKRFFSDRYGISLWDWFYQTVAKVQ